MSSHLKQAIHKVSKAGQDLAMQATGDEYSDLAKAQCFDILLYEVQEMLGYAVGTIPTYTPDPDTTFEGLKNQIYAIGEDGELKEFIRNLEKSIDEDIHKGRIFVKVVK